MISMPTAMRSFSRCTAASILRSSFSIPSTMSAGDWNSLKSDLTNSTMFPAQLSCGGEAAVSVGIRRKRSGGTTKPGVKIDIDWYVANQSWHTLRKLSLDFD